MRAKVVLLKTFCPKLDSLWFIILKLFDIPEQLKRKQCDSKNIYLYDLTQFHQVWFLDFYQTITLVSFQKHLNSH